PPDPRQGHPPGGGDRRSQEYDAAQGTALAVRRSAGGPQEGRAAAEGNRSSEDDADRRFAPTRRRSAGGSSVPAPVAVAQLTRTYGGDAGRAQRRPDDIASRIFGDPCPEFRHREGVMGKVVLGIETSCGESAAAVLADGRRVLSSVVASQDDVHAPYGGVVPELASRRHIEMIVPVVEKALTDAGVALGDLDGIAVPYGPGLLAAGGLLDGQGPGLGPPSAPGRRQPPRGPRLRIVPHRGSARVSLPGPG